MEVLVRLERARFRRHVQRTMIVATLAAALAAATAPEIYAWMAADPQRLWLVALGTAAVLCVLSLALIVPRLRSMASDVSRMLYP